MFVVHTSIPIDPDRRFVEALPDLAAGTLETIQFETRDVARVEFEAADAIE